MILNICGGYTEMLRTFSKCERFRKSASNIIGLKSASNVVGLKSASGVNSSRPFSSIVGNELNRDEFDHTITSLRSFFMKRGWKEVVVQHRPSILAACEDPWTISHFDFEGRRWPLPQTGQMWLEDELLKQPDVDGIYTLTTSYRQEPNPIPGRHQTIFPMFEFEGKGDYVDLRNMEKDLLEHLGFDCTYKNINYSDACECLGTESIEAEEERELCDMFGNVVFLNRFPENTSPFWNMKREYFRVPTGASDTEWARKTDVIIHGHETIGSAERETNKDIMRQRFETISDGKYSQKIFELFGEDRVREELDKFLSHTFIPRYGGGIGVHRLIDGMRKQGIFKNNLKPNSTSPLYPNFSIV